SSDAIKVLKGAGFNHAVRMSGGMTEWRAQNLTFVQKKCTGKTFVSPVSKTENKFRIRHGRQHSRTEQHTRSRSWRGQRSGPAATGARVCPAAYLPERCLFRISPQPGCVPEPMGSQNHLQPEQQERPHRRGHL